MNQLFALTFLFFVGQAFVNSQKCGPDEVAVNCINLCNTCHLKKNCYDVCIPGCDCKQGYYRTSIGRCVNGSLCIYDSANHCPGFEFFVPCYGHCENDCKNKDKIVCHTGVCVSECRCYWGYVRGPKGTCIPPKECPAKDETEYPVKRVCPYNEYWDESTAHCQENCTNLGHPIPCPKISVSGCVCKKEYVRENSGRCIPRSQCPKKAEDEIFDQDELVDQAASFCPPNEFFVECFGHCESDCKDKNKTFCARQLCVSECRCNWGYVRGPKGTCIKPERCPLKDDTKYPVKRVCPANEHWDPSRAHCQNNCTNIGKPIRCLKIAVGGCVCDKGFYRGKDGKCIKQNQCLKKTIDVGFEDTFISPDEDEEERDFFENEDEEEAYFQGE